MQRTRKPATKPGKLGVKDLMEVAGLGRDSVYNGIRARQLPGSIVGGRVVLTEEAFELFRLLGHWPPAGGLAMIAQDRGDTAAIPADLVQALDEIASQYATVTEKADAIGRYFARYVLTLQHP